MNCLFWNCQGLGGPLTIHTLGDLLRQYNPGVVFLSETKASQQHIERLKSRWNYNGVAVDRVGKAGGLALFWRKDLNVDLLSFSQNHIDVRIEWADVNKKWRLTGFYGWPEQGRRSFSWQLLQTLHGQMNEPWIIGGDFNEILSNSEKEGGLARQPHHIADFRSALEECDLTDLGFIGYPFTWTNSRESPYTVRCRLDRICTHTEGFTMFPQAAVRHLECVGSDHLPLMLQLIGAQTCAHRPKRRPFRFEAIWAKREDCEEIVRQAWDMGPGGTEIADLLHRTHECRAALMTWSRGTVRLPKLQIEAYQKRLHLLSSSDQTPAVQEEIRNLRAKLEKLYADNDLYWRQRSKVQWIKDGDRNTKFFHAKATSRQRTNRVDKMKDSSGIWRDKSAEIEQIISDYFGQIFQSTNPDENKIDMVLEHLEPRVSAAANQLLSLPFSADEVTLALSHMSPLKSPGHDGLPVLFFTKYWHIIGSDVVSCVLDFLNHKHLPPALNFTFIVLIPKNKKPERITEYRPISLCNVVYKIGSKVVANRMKRVLNDIISPTQSAFVPNRLITDNILVAYEVNHFIRTKSSKRTNYMAIKLDISKAYDRIEWVFLRKILLRLGFVNEFVDLIMLCVTTVSYAFLFNGSQFGSVLPSRGLRQGDPLSPYLFICCAEALILLIQTAVEHGELRGIQIAHSAPIISNLCFADDTLLFSQATVEDASKLKQILEQYARISGQVLNYDKTTICFSPTTPTGVKEAIHGYLGVQEVDTQDKYLGMPASMGKSRREIFSFLRDRIWSKIKGWGAKQLSYAGKEVLVKAVLQAIPSYIMSCFILPNGLLMEMETAIRRFWWGNGSDRKISWLAWNRMCLPKDKGGLGFRDIRSFNYALVAKQIWRVLTKPDLLLSRILKAKYFPEGNILSADVGNRPSATWQSLLKARHILMKGLRRRIGNGKETSLWADPWLSDEGSFRILTRRPIDTAWPDKVSDIIDQNTGGWDVQKIDETFWSVDRNRILAIPVGSQEASDRWMWHYSNNGRFTVRSCYYNIVTRKLLAQTNQRDGMGSVSGESDREWKKVWNLNVPPKIRIFIWRACLDILPTQVELYRRRISSSPICLFCGTIGETTLHSVRVCRGMDQVWAAPPFGISGVQNFSSFWNWFVFLHESLEEDHFLLAVVVMWGAWYHRNKSLHGEASLTVDELVPWCRSYLAAYQSETRLVARQRQEAHATAWVPPPEGVIKVNFDAAFPVGADYYVASLVARNSQGKCVVVRDEIPG